MSIIHQSCKHQLKKAECEAIAAKNAKTGKEVFPFGCTEEQRFGKKGAQPLKGTLVEEVVHENLPATDPGKQKEICAKDCGHALNPMTWPCASAKLQAGCGGGPQLTGCLMLGLPDFGLGQLGCFIIPGVALGLILLFVMLKK